MAKEKPDIVLTDGKEITFDFNLLTVREWRSLFDRSQPDSEEDAIIAKVAGLDPEYIPEMAFPEWRRLSIAFYRAANAPLDDPN